MSLNNEFQLDVAFKANALRVPGQYHAAAAGFCSPIKNVPVPPVVSTESWGRGSAWESSAQGAAAALSPRLTLTHPLVESRHGPTHINTNLTIGQVIRK